MAEAATGAFGTIAKRKTRWLAIPAAGAIGGTLDILQASLLFGWSVPKVIAAGLLGPQAIQGGAGMYVLGLALHYFIATSWAAIYFATSRKLEFLTEHPVVCGLMFGIVVELVMNLGVLPLCALHARGPYELHDLLLGLGVHMVIFGLPVALAIRKFGR